MTAGPTPGPPPVSLLVTVTGRDRPGVTAALCGRLAEHGATLLDVEQVVLRGRLVLGLLVEADPAAAGAVRTAAAALGLEVEVARATPEEPVRRPRHVVTLLGEPLPAAALGLVAAAVAGCGANIERVSRLSREPLVSLELVVDGGDADRLGREVAAAAAVAGVDCAVQRASLYRRATRLVCLDVDSTLAKGEVIDALAARAGCGAQVAAVTAAAMAGELDFEASLRARVALLAGLPWAEVLRVRDEVVLTPGAATLVRTLRRLGYVVAAVSGGFTVVTDALAVQLGLDRTLANELEVTDGRLTGRLVGPVVDRAAKADALERFAWAARIPLAQTVAVGDGANDLDMLARAGLGIAFNAKPAVRAAADVSVNVPYLDAVLFLLGISREEVEAAGCRPAAHRTALLRRVVADDVGDDVRRPLALGDPHLAGG